MSLLLLFVICLGLAGGVPAYCSGVLFLAKYCSYGHMKEGEISRAYDTHGEKRIAYRLWMINYEGERPI